jgi:hypothetical protein
MSWVLPSGIPAGIPDPVGFRNKLILPWNDLISTSVQRNWKLSAEFRGFRKMRPFRNRNIKWNAQPKPPRHQMRRRRRGRRRKHSSERRRRRRVRIKKRDSKRRQRGRGRWRRRGKGKRNVFVENTGRQPFCTLLCSHVGCGRPVYARNVCREHGLRCSHVGSGKYVYTR